MKENPLEWAVTYMMAQYEIAGTYCKFPENTIRYIRTKNVVSTLWNQGRFNYWFDELSKPIHREPPPIVTQKVVIQPRTFYILTDGNHRTEAYKHLDIRLIKAEISGEVTVNKGSFVLVDQEQLWVEIPNAPFKSYKIITTGLSPECAGELINLGVKTAGQIIMENHYEISKKR